jgi:hypothetical protein
MAQGARPGKQTLLGYRQFSGRIDFVAERDAFMRLAMGELSIESKTGYRIVETMLRIPVFLTKLSEGGKIPKGMKHKIVRFVGPMLDQAALAEIAIRYEDLLITRLVRRGDISPVAAQQQRDELATFAQSKLRAAAFQVSTWLTILQKISEPRGRGGGRAVRLLPTQEDVEDWAICTFAAQMTVLRNLNATSDDPSLFFTELPESIRRAIDRKELARKCKNDKTNFELHLERIRRKAMEWLTPTD